MRVKRVIFVIVLLFSSFFFLETALAATGTDSLVGYWKLDETSQGNDATDSSGDGSTGTAYGTDSGPSINTDPATTSFPNTRSVTFNGSDQYFDMLDTAPLNITNNFTVSLWMKPAVLNVLSIAFSNGADDGSCLGGAAVCNGFSFGIGNGAGGVGSKLQGLIPSIGWIDTGYTFPAPDAWYHIIMVRDDGTSKFYVNGTQTPSTSTTAPSGDPTKLTIGSQQPVGRWFNGSLDDVRVYNRVISSAEITALANGDHPSSTWDGSASTDYEAAANWNTNAIPDPYSNILIADETDNPVLTADIAIAGLTINANGILDLAGFDLTINDSGSFSNSGTLILDGDETLTNLTNDTTGTITYNDSGTHASGLILGDTYNNLTFNGGGSWTLGAALDVNNNLTITSGTLASGGNNITVAGNWSNSDTYTHGDNTVTLDGTSQSISGTSTFYNLTKTVTSTDTLTLEADFTQTIANTTTFQGQENQPLLLRSSTSGTQWKFNPQGTRSITYIHVQDSHNINSSPIVFDDQNDFGSNLTNWDTINPNSSSPNQSNNCNQTPTGAPNLFNLVPSKTEVTLYFTPVNTNQYYVSYSTNPNAEEHGQIININYKGVQEYTVNSLTPNTTYYFKVRGHSNCQTGEWSDIKSAYTQSKGFFSSTASFVKPKKQMIIKDITTENPPSLEPSPEPVEKIGYDVLIKINHQGQPLNNATVELHSDPQISTTNEKGEVSFKNVTGGDHTLKISYQEYQAEQPLKVEGDNQQFNVSISVELTQKSSLPTYLWLILIAIPTLSFIVLFKKNNDNN